MGDLSTIPGTRIAFSAFDPHTGEPPFYELGKLEGGILRSLPTSDGAQLLPEKQTHFGYVERGELDVTVGGAAIRIPAGFYFSLPGPAVIEPRGIPEGVVISKLDFRGFLQVGQLEWRGRLRYINGCTDSLLISPIKMGDPCLNLLFFPTETDQTMHTHPSDRIGMILSGSGICVTEDERGRVVTDLKAGMLFCIHTGGKHKFQTFGTSMRVLAYHPDSDFGPTDEVHPMINRTMVDGVSASQLQELHTTSDARQLYPFVEPKVEGYVKRHTE